ncbi:thiamine pyrophosphate-dependent enzyme [Geomicrobium sp. JCM 19055]|uniref:thiamine pyrophosphate-dependent enzyme n=1 Tax=Geomicrobium sp. JCM 19055 TaxID=1460649 RepID=UPI00223667F5|nr:thiamine pyrophosphate-dependent enzyme [Geomicrobium sp. JCM 19055]
MGQSLPTAIGAQIGQPNQKCLVFAGDGGFMVNLGEMATAVEEKLPLVVVLFDDHGYGVLRNIQDATYGRRVAVDLHTPDFVQLAQSIGFQATRVKTTDDFGEALENAIQEPGPTMVVVDMISIGPPAKAGGISPAVAKEFEPK